MEPSVFAIVELPIKIPELVIPGCPILAAFLFFAARVGYQFIH
jgi:hypothetical protein